MSEQDRSLKNVIAYIEEVIAEKGNDITDYPLECAAANLLYAYYDLVAAYTKRSSAYYELVDRLENDYD